MTFVRRSVELSRRMLPLVLMLLPVHASYSQSHSAVAASARIMSQVDYTQKTAMSGTVPYWALAENDLGRAPSGTRMTNMHLVLSRAPQVEAGFRQFLVDVQNPSSAQYHKFLSPQQMADQYGIASSDLGAVKTWLNSVGLQVDDVAAGGVFITFSGSVAAVENAFGAELHNFQQEGKARIASTSELSIPVSLSGVIGHVVGVSQTYVSLHSHTMLAPSNKSDGKFHANASFSNNVDHALAPADFNTIYDITTPINSGFNGTGNRVAIIINSDVAAADITAYQSLFGVTAAAPTTKVVPGFSDPGLSTDSEGEADLDVQRVMGTAPGAGIDLLVFNDPNLSDTSIDSVLQYEISTLNDPIVNMSFGACDSGSSALSRDQTFDSYASTAAGQGISIFVSSGDNAAAGCNANYNTIPATQVLATNVICASSSLVCVGGTEFNDPSAASYWSATNNATTKASALGYIPEGGWNEPTELNGSTTEYIGLGSGGGITKLSKPSWQNVTGVPSDTSRHVPDISFTAAGHDRYLICQVDIGDDSTTGQFNYFILGTSASSPSMAGIQAIINQKTGSRQGAMGPVLYGAYPNNSTTNAFHDVTVTSSGVASCAVTTPSMCNNSTPKSTSLTGGLSGYLVTTGYDQVTGLGSLDVNNFLATLSSAAPTFSVTPASLPISLVSGAITGNTDNITVASVNSFADTVTMSCSVSNGSGTAAGSCALASGSVTLASGGLQTDLLTITTTPGTSGVLNVTVTGINGSTTVTTSTIVVTLTASGYIMSANPNTTMVAGGATAASVITLTSQNGFAGTVAVSCAGSFVSSTGTTTVTSCSASPSSVMLTAGGMGMTHVTIPTTAGVAGVLTATVSGSGVPTGGTIAATASATVAVTVTAPGITANGHLLHFRLLAPCCRAQTRRTSSISHRRTALPA